jgi:TolB-like protein/Flp pilus assembly protein TadD
LEGSHLSAEQEAIALVRQLHSIELSRFRVVGGIVRYDEPARNILKDTKQKIVTSLTSQIRGRDNYLIWAPPGSGKSFFVQEIAKSLGDKIEYTELNLAQIDEQKFRTELSKIERANKPRLCFIDEVDSKPSESWPYEALLPSLEPSDRNAIRACFIVAGSGGNSLSEMKERIAKRPKGADLLSRVPTRNESSIPRLTLGDRLLVASTQFLRASSEKGRQTDEVEKLVLYYIALNPNLNSARQIRDLAIRCIERMPSGEERVKFDYLFDAGDPENKEFWHRAGSLRTEFVNTFVRLEDDQIVFKPLQMAEVLDRQRIAVLPFANMSPNQNDEYFSDGMTEEIISAICTISGLKVISRTSAMKYKGTEKVLPEIGRELDVGSILEGSVRKAGKKVRIAVQLIDVCSDVHKWSQTYDRELEDIFAIQSDIARQVAHALKVNLLETEKRLIGKQYTQDAEAHNLYLKGRFHWHKANEPELRKAIEFFQAAIKRDPKFALAYVGLADSYIELCAQGCLNSKETFDLAKPLVMKALELDDLVPEAHSTLATLLQDYDWDWNGAERRFRRAIELNPNWSVVCHSYAVHLALRGRFEQAIAEIKHAQELDPFDLGIHDCAAETYRVSNRLESAISECEKELEIDPKFYPAYIKLGKTYLQKSNFEKGVLMMQKAAEISNGTAIARAYLAYAYGVSGKKEEARQIINELLETSKNQFVSPIVIAVAFAGLSDRASTMDWLEEAFNQRAGGLPKINVDPMFDDLRVEPRFQELLRKIGF